MLNLDIFRFTSGGERGIIHLLCKCFTAVVTRLWKSVHVHTFPQHSFLGSIEPVHFVEASHPSLPGHCKNDHTPLGLLIFPNFWRREGDSNPRYPCEYTRVPGEPIRPLWHLSIWSCFFEPYCSNSKGLFRQVYRCFGLAAALIHNQKKPHNTLRNPFWLLILRGQYYSTLQNSSRPSFGFF